MQILTARPHRLLSEIIRRIGERSAQGEPCMLLVPSQYTLQAEIEVMTRLNLTGSFLIDVLSPTRLKTRIFERAGQPEQTILDERGKCMILSQVLSIEKENLSIYRAAAEGGQDGFIAKVSALIADMKRSGMDAASLTQALEKLPPESHAGKKLRDASILFTGYEAKIAGKLADGEDVSHMMREKMRASGVLENKHVFVFGFDMITETFARDLIAMRACCKSLTIAVETDDNSAADGRLFAPVNYSIVRTIKLAEQAGISPKWERLRAPLDAPWDIALLEQRLFALGAYGNAQPAEHISLHTGSTPRAEVHRAAAQIRSLAMAGEEIGSMAVVYPKGSSYGPLLASILPMYGVSAYIAASRPASAHPLCRFVLSSLRVVSAGFVTADVVECIRSGFMPIMQEEADALIAYAEGLDVRGDSWKRPFTYIKNAPQEALDAINESREAVVAPLSRLQNALKKAKHADDTIAAILRLLEDVSAFDRLGNMRQELLDAGMDTEAEDSAQVWNALMETLDQLHTLLGEEAMPAKDVLSQLTSGLSALELSALPPADGALICGEIGNVRTAQVDTLFVLGMNDEGGAGESALLSPAEREEAVRATGAYLGMTAGERAALAQMDILKVLSGAKKQLILSYALADETGRALREGSAVQGIRRLFPTMTAHGGLPQEELQNMLCAPEAALEALSVHLSRAADGKEPLDDAFAQTYAALDASETLRERLIAVTRKLSQEPPRALDGTQARSLYGRPVMSVSRLEMFAQCPYQHFVRYGLAPQKELEPGVDRAELGTLYHQAAEQFTRAITAQPDFPHIPQETCDRLMDEAVSPLIDGWRTSPLGESARGGAIAGRIRKTARRAGRNILSQFEESQFAPMHYEMAFGQGGAAPIMLELADGSFAYLQGRIDRIDVFEDDKTRIRVIDYKSGTKKFDPTMAYWGIQLQLLIYLSAALTQLPGASPAGFFYCRIADPMVKTESRIKDEVEKQIAKKLALAGISLSDVTVLRAQDAHHQQMITKDGKPSGRYAASMADEAGMQALVDFARSKAARLAGEAFGGDIDDSPAVHGLYNACSFCDYAAVCGFDPARKARRRLSKKTVEDLRPN